MQIAIQMDSYLEAIAFGKLEMNFLGRQWPLAAKETRRSSNYPAFGHMFVIFTKRNERFNQTATWLRRADSIVARLVNEGKHLISRKRSSSVDKSSEVVPCAPGADTLGIFFSGFISQPEEYEIVQVKDMRRFSRSSPECVKRTGSLCRPSETTLTFCKATNHFRSPKITFGSVNFPFCYCFFFVKFSLESSRFIQIATSVAMLGAHLHVIVIVIKSKCWLAQAHKRFSFDELFRWRLPLLGRIVSRTSSLCFYGRT